jgi:hypothetical protein
MPQGDYTIQAPGLADIIRIPALESTELKQQRIQRMRNARTPIPPSIQWIPSAINFLDDAQDTLITLLLAGKLTGLLAKIPARFIPALGWVLLANDILNLGTSILGAATTGRFPKRDLLQGTKNFTSGRAGRVTAAHQFLKKRFPWLPFILQGGQVLHAWTGYGLQLGTIMGAVSDTMWGMYQAYHGKGARIIAPPPADPIAKMSRYLSQQWILPWIAPALTDDEIKLAVVAGSASIMGLGDHTAYKLDDQRLEAWAMTDTVGYDVWPQQSLEAMEAEGIKGEIINLDPGNYSWAGDSISSSVRNSIALDPYLDEFLSQKLPKTAESQAIQQVYELATDNIWNIYGNEDATIAPLNTPWERLLSRAFHANVFPPWMVEPCPADQVANLNRPPRDRRCRWLDWIFTPKYVDKPMRLPRLYPPLVQDRNWQLFWWLTITLGIMCRRPYQWGNWRGTGIAGAVYFDGTTGVVGPAGTWDPLAVASLLVWGNVWSRDISQNEVEYIVRENIRWCVNDPNTGWPKIEGERKALFAWDALRQLLPEPGDVGTGAEYYWDQDQPYDPTGPPNPIPVPPLILGR